MCSQGPAYSLTLSSIMTKKHLDISGLPLQQNWPSRDLGLSVHALLTRHRIHSRKGLTGWFNTSPPKQLSSLDKTTANLTTPWKVAIVMTLHI